jgi:hypothetical protein
LNYAQKTLDTKNSDVSPGGAWPPPSPLGEGGINSRLLPGEKVLRYEADEGFLGLRLVIWPLYGAAFTWASGRKAGSW